jgi:hypothetical protein
MRRKCGQRDTSITVAFLLLSARDERPELCGRLGDEVRSGSVVSRHFDDLNAVLEFDASDDFRQLVFTFQSPPGTSGFVWGME